MRVVLDTNILVRAVSQRSSDNFIFDLLFNGNITLCVTTEILLEYEEILTKIYDQETASLVIASLNLLPNVIRTEVYYDLKLIINDVDDDKFVNCAFASNAHCIITDDKHFKVLNKIPFPKITVLKLSEFKSLLS
jgi:uncharacterized protein